MEIIVSLRKNYVLILILVFFAAIYSSVSLVNHYNFRTYGFDLGIYNNALYDYSHLRVSDNPVIGNHITNVLSDHLSFYHFIYAPFRYILGSWTLLIFQILAILLGGIGIFKSISLLTKSKTIPYLALIHFFSMWGIYSALSFDYHDNVVAAMVVPWYFFSILKRSTKHIILCSVLLIISKENIALWLSFIALGTAIWQYKDAKIRNLNLFISVFSIIYFILAIKVFMPYFGGGRAFAHLNYHALGNSLPEYFKTMVTRPLYTLSLLFKNHSPNVMSNGIKAELHFVILLSGGVALLLRPQFLIMLIPIYAQKLFHTSFVKWGINLHYSIEFVPIITFALYYLLLSLSNKKLLYSLASISLILCILTTNSRLHHRKSKWYSRENADIFYKKHYSTNYNVTEIRNELDKIPGNAKICAQNMLVPHLSFREWIYVFPNINNADYIITIPTSGNFWPYNEEKYLKKIEELKQGNYKVIKESPSILILKKK